jgi:hypothetical protein
MSQPAFGAARSHARDANDVTRFTFKRYPPRATTPKIRRRHATREDIHGACMHARTVGRTRVAALWRCAVRRSAQNAKAGSRAVCVMLPSEPADCRHFHICPRLSAAVTTISFMSRTLRRPFTDMPPDEPARRRRGVVLYALFVAATVA